MKHIFIINPFSGLVDKTEQIRHELSRRKDIDAIVFNTEETGHETQLMKEMLDIFDDEPVRIFVCGGSGTLSNAIDAIDIDDMEHVEIGFYPCGLTNDFLKNFTEQGKRFENINSIIDGKAKYIDYMRCVVDGNDKEIKNELLFVTMGVTANIERLSRVMKILGRVNPTIMYGICTICALPFSTAIDYEVIIDGVDYSREYKMLYIGNSLCMGGGFIPIKSNINCRDGYINVLLVKKIPAFSALRYLTEFMHGELCEKHKEDAEVIVCKEISVRRKDNRPMSVNADGEIYSSYSWNIKVTNGRLKFIIPEDAKFIENASDLINCKGYC